MMVGWFVFFRIEKKEVNLIDIIFFVKDLVVEENRGGVLVVKNLLLDVWVGEIVGIVGIDGNG